MVPFAPTLRLHHLHVRRRTWLGWLHNSQSSFRANAFEGEEFIFRWVFLYFFNLLTLQ